PASGPWTPLPAVALRESKIRHGASAVNTRLSLSASALGEIEPLPALPATRPGCIPRVADWDFMKKSRLAEKSSAVSDPIMLCRSMGGIDFNSPLTLACQTAASSVTSAGVEGSG